MFNSRLLLGAAGGDPLNGVMGPVYDYHGFRLQRHISDKATVITYKAADATIERMAVLDAMYRSVLQFGTSGIDVPTLTNFQEGGKYAAYITSNTAIPNTQPMPASVTNDAIFDNWSDSLKTDKAARANCDLWMSYNDQSDFRGILGVPAVAWCRGHTLAGRPCDLGNEYQTMVMWACGDKLDEMDKTSADYPNLLLGYTAAPGGASQGRCQQHNGHQTDRLVSSTDFDSDLTRAVGWLGGCHGSYKYEYGTVVPILELNS